MLHAPIQIWLFYLSSRASGYHENNVGDNVAHVGRAELSEHVTVSAGLELSFLTARWRNQEARSYDFESHELLRIVTSKRDLAKRRRV